MRVSRYSVDLGTMQTQNYLHRERIDHMRDLLGKIDSDPDKKARLRDCLCPMCWYEKSRIGGAAVCSVQCAFCKTVMRFGNTCVDWVCLECAKMAGICRHCGADLGYRDRRKVSFPAIEENVDENYS